MPVTFLAFALVVLQSEVVREPEISGTGYPKPAEDPSGTVATPRPTKPPPAQLSRGATARATPRGAPTGAPAERPSAASGRAAKLAAPARE